MESRVEMDQFYPLIFIAVAVLVVVVYTYAHRRLTTSEAFTEVGRALPARVTGGGWLTWPTLKFHHAHQPVTVSVLRSPRGSRGLCTRFQTVWPDRKLFLIVCPTSTLGVYGRSGSTAIATGSQLFDSRYHAFARGDRSQASRLLTPAVQQAFEGIRQFRGKDAFFFSIDEGNLFLEHPDTIEDARNLRHFVRLCTFLVDQLLSTDTTGIEFLDGIAPVEPLLFAPETQPEDAVCQVCGESIRTSAVLCRSCKTPHHRDCWEYYGACSTYGCGQREFLVP